MKTQEIIKALRRLKANTGAFALNCLGCGYEYNCSIHGCRVLREAADRLEELFNAKSDSVIYLKIIKALYAKSSIYSLFLCAVLFVNLLEAFFSRNAIKVVVFAIALVMALWVAYKDIKSIGEAKREANAIAEQILSQDEIQIGR